MKLKELEETIRLTPHKTIKMKDYTVYLLDSKCTLLLTVVLKGENLVHARKRATKILRIKQEKNAQSTADRQDYSR